MRSEKMSTVKKLFSHVPLKGIYGGGEGGFGSINPFIFRSIEGLK